MEAADVETLAAGEFEGIDIYKCGADFIQGHETELQGFGKNFAISIPFPIYNTPPFQLPRIGWTVKDFMGKLNSQGVGPEKLIMQ